MIHSKSFLSHLNFAEKGGFQQLSAIRLLIFWLFWVLMAIDLSNISGLSVSICLTAVLSNDSDNESVGLGFHSFDSSSVRPDLWRSFSQLSRANSI